MSNRSLRLWAHGALVIGLSLSALAFAQDSTESESAPADPAAAPDSQSAPEEAATSEAIPVAPVATAPEESLEVKEAAGSGRLDTVEVTGSRLKRTDMEGSQPVFSVTREDIERTGMTDITEILRRAAVSGNNSLSPAQGRFALTMGESNLDLRNLGSNHTLLLVDGHRWVTGLNQTSTSVSDYNTIPTAIIERVDILKDGASAIYGSDAIAGVVNIITRKNFDGLAVSYNLGQYYQQRDGTNQQASLSWGLNSVRSNLFVNLSYTDQAIAPNENRPFTARPNVGPTRDSIVTPNALLRFVKLGASPQSTFYNCPNLQAGIAAAAAADTPLGGPVAMTQIIPAGLILCDLTLNPGAAGGTLADYHQIQRTNPDDVYNRFADGTLKEPNERIAFFTQFRQDLTDSISLNLQGLYNQRRSNSVGQNAYLGGGNLDGGPKGYLAYISANNEFNPFAQEIGFDSSCGGTGDSGADPAGPTCTGIGDGAGSWAIRRAKGLNNQTFVDNVDTYRASGGFAGDLDVFGKALQWELGYIYSHNKIEETLSSVNYEKAGKALGAFGTTCDGDCVPLNVFQGAAGLTQAAVDYVLDDAWQRNSNRQDIAYLNLSTDIGVFGEMLPGPIAAALGGEFRREQYDSQIDPIIQQGLIRLNSQNPLKGKTYSREVYAELGIPLAKDQPLAEDLELDLAGRISSFPRIGSVRTGKIGLRWQPARDLLLRGTYSTGFRAPNVGELYLGAAQSYDPLLDPCADPGTNTNADLNCLQDGTPGGGQGGNVTTPYDLWQGNLDLKPERSKNLTYGLVFAPQWLPDFSLGIDFYDISVRDFVVIGQGQFFLDSCYKADTRNYCDTIHRDAAGSLVYVDTPYFNLARVDTAGLDIGINYLLPLPATLGRFKLNLDSTYLKNFTYTSPQPGAADQVENEVGKASGQFQGYPRWKANGYLSWELNRFKASWSTRMAYHMTEDCGDLFPTPSLEDLGLCSHPSTVIGTETDPDTGLESDIVSEPTNRLHTIFYHDVQIGYEFDRLGADISIGVNNVLDQLPVVSRSVTSLYWYNYDPHHYEVPGRFGYVRVGFKF